LTTTINASTSSGLVNSADTSGILQLQTASTAAVTITAGQLVGIGTASPTVQLLNIAATSISGPTNNPAGVQLTDSGASLSSQIVNRSGNTLHNVPTSKAHSFQVNSTETVGLNTYGIGLGGTTPTSGMGITFPATQSASSDATTLDDYEEGTWTPVFVPDAGSITGGTKYGSYTKVGNLVSIQIFIGGTFTVSSPSGGMKITGFPFACGATNPNGLPAFGVASYSMNAGAYAISVEMASSTTIAYIFNFANGSRSDASTYINANTQILIGGTYRTTT